MVCNNVDWDSLFSYQTVKIVRIRDKRLGILHLSFMGAIILYIVIVTILLQQQYLAIQTPIGSIRNSLLAPANRSQYLPYCQNSTNLNYNGFPTKECQYWDETLVMYPPSSEYSLFITTRVSSSTQETFNNCSLTEFNCTYVNVANSTKDFYIADVDTFTVLVDHTMAAPTLGIQYNAKQLPGFMLNSKGKKITLTPPNIVGVVDQYDILTLDAILNAADIASLDSPGFSNSSRSIRDDGMLLFCFITYSNTFTYSTSKYRYTYEFHLIEDTKFKIVEPIYLDDVNHRYIFNRHGVRIIFIQTGQLGKFDFQTSLLTFVSGIGLLTVATLVVDIIAVRLLPQRNKYSMMKYQDSGLKRKPLLGDSETIEPETPNQKDESGNIIIH
ncbi:hypothetical protein CYY_008776 [Polysphondylium violaceum]|uniref:Purinergic receptor n=1 Tax=Polysphondylium violaceum TaxID=133409 RepID=A0A8J4PMX8_9MYCE|nr:hypothetical protein CYY_008776 [Polysphondylium violaceum]